MSDISGNLVKGSASSAEIPGIELWNVFTADRHWRMVPQEYRFLFRHCKNNVKSDTTADGKMGKMMTPESSMKYWISNADAASTSMAQSRIQGTDDDHLDALKGQQLWSPVLFHLK